VFCEKEVDVPAISPEERYGPGKTCPGSMYERDIDEEYGQRMSLCSC
jgi:hypothetical protein